MHNDLWQSYHPNGVPKQGEGWHIASFTLFTLMNTTMSRSIWLMVKRRHCAGCRMTHSVR